MNVLFDLCFNALLLISKPTFLKNISGFAGAACQSKQHRKIKTNTQGTFTPSSW
jgi:hypothetical protein